MLPGLLRGQCDPLPLPYTTDLLTGFQPPSNHPTVITNLNLPLRLLIKKVFSTQAIKQP